MILKIYRAADAFLYLPSYVAEEYKIFETLFSSLPGHQNISVVFDTPKDKWNIGGDVVALNRMVRASNEDDDTLAIAICSPSVIMSNDVSLEVKEECSVIAGIIDKLPFWGINHKQKEYDNLNELIKDFESVVYYNENYKEGNYLGKKIKQSPRVNFGFLTEFGEEINVLDREYSKDTNRNIIAVSADIISIVKSTNRQNDPLKINYRFSKSENFLTTGIITTKKYCEKYPEILSKIIEAIQKSITIIYSSEFVALQICKKIGEKINPNMLPSPLELNEIVKIITEEKFYPANLNVTEESWSKAIKGLSKTESWEHDKNTQTAIEESYNKYIDNSHVLRSERSIAKQFGIGLDTFEEETQALIKSITIPIEANGEVLKKENFELKKSIGKSYKSFLWFSRNLSAFIKILFSQKILAIVCFIGSLLLIGVYYHYFVTEPITSKDIFLAFGISLPLGIFGSVAASYLFQNMMDRKNNDRT